MKRRDLIKHIEKNGCTLLREGGKYSIYVNKEGKEVPVTRHPELEKHTASKLCKLLSIPKI